MTTSFTNPETKQQSQQADQLWDRYKTVRMFSETLCEPLATEDYVVQTMPDVSPIKWHLAHTSWFFETFILRNVLNDYQIFHPQYNYLFNSYYNNVGDQFEKPLRGILSRPTVQEIYQYRRHIDDSIRSWMENATTQELNDWASMVELGLHHEQQHQELMVTDIKHIFYVNPLQPVYHQQDFLSTSLVDMGWIPIEEGVYEIGFNGDGFAYDNESPRHRQYLHSSKVANRLVTNGEFLQFIEAGGYHDFRYWLSLGWETVKANGWQAPMYWFKQDGEWYEFTLSGTRPIQMNKPVTHVSYFEADAFARWAGARLPSEAEWEIIAQEKPVEGNFADDEIFHPTPVDGADGHGANQQWFGDVWEWTNSAYAPYPGYQPAEGALGEYNGKWMCNQYVLRGGSCATSKSHIRPTYRNFFPPEARWQFKGIRLAKDQ